MFCKNSEVLDAMALKGNKDGVGLAVLVMAVLHTNSIIRISPVANNALETALKFNKKDNSFPFSIFF